MQHSRSSGVEVGIFVSRSFAFYRQILVLILTLSFFHVSQAKYTYILDFDGTIVDDARTESSWKTPWVLRRIDRVRSSTQLSDELRRAPQKIQISFAEYVFNLGKWSVGDGSIGNYSPIQLPEDPFLIRPKQIVPGYYYVDLNVTFRFYKTGSEGENYAVQNYLEAKERIKKSKLDPMDFAGRAFPLLAQATNDPLTVGNLHIFTARDQSQRQFNELFDLLQRHGHIEHAIGKNKRGLPTTPTVHNLQGIDSILYGRSLVEGKLSVVESIARQLSNSSAPKTLDYSAKDPSKIIETHTVIVAEDDPTNATAIIDLLVSLSHANSTRKIKLVFMNTATDKVLSGLSYPYNSKWLVFEQGFPRQASPQEVSNYLGDKPLAQPSIRTAFMTSDFSMCLTYLDSGVL